MVPMRFQSKHYHADYSDDKTPGILTIRDNNIPTRRPWLINPFSESYMIRRAYWATMPGKYLSRASHNVNLNSTIIDQAVQYTTDQPGPDTGYTTVIRQWLCHSPHDYLSRPIIGRVQRLFIQLPDIDC